MKRLILVLGLVAVGTGCSMKIRNVTAEAWTDQGVYVGYWEGTCKAFLGCDRGAGMVNWCKLNESTNELACAEQTAITPLLSRKPGAAVIAAPAPAPAVAPEVTKPDAEPEAAPEGEPGEEGEAAPDVTKPDGASEEGASEEVPAEAEEPTP